MRYKKKFIALDNFTINHNFQIFVEKLNKRKTSAFMEFHTGIMGDCALQAFEIYYQMFHNQNNFKSIKYHFIEKEGFLDENFKDKNDDLSKMLCQYRYFDKTSDDVRGFGGLFERMYCINFLGVRFLKTQNLRAFLEKEEFFKVPILCNIRDKDAFSGHINILYRDEKGLFVINTNESSKNKIKLIEPHNGDIFALEEIAYNWTGEFELVGDFRLYIPYENIELEEEELNFKEDFEEKVEKEQKEELEFKEDFEEHTKKQKKGENDENELSDGFIIYYIVMFIIIIIAFKGLIYVL
ncbi:TPA: hypothetical protein R1X42_000580 [Campylobacter upsaliensis]|nr:hypothetical protein [Campylobacter upsaliensis]HEC1579658.1 hypothetical protein [Campylobacter upsaliensis]HEC1581372.1 hypothetical protein [Campylobacter upsaliensis]HEO8741506.1 hypothetical protein [Campylobacter upsaliensis]